MNAEILLPRRDKMARGQVICQKQDANCNLIGRSNQNPILDTYLYEVEFPGGEITELVVIIAESMYAQCDANGNEYLLLESFINHRKNGPALSIEDQKVVIKGQEMLRKSTADKTDPHHGRSYPTLRNHTQSKLPNTP